MRPAFERVGKYYPQIFLNDCMSYKNATQYKETLKTVRVTFLMT